MFPEGLVGDPSKTNTDLGIPKTLCGGTEQNQHSGSRPKGLHGNPKTLGGPPKAAPGASLEDLKRQCWF